MDKLHSWATHHAIHMDTKDILPCVENNITGCLYDQYGNEFDINWTIHTTKNEIKIAMVVIGIVIFIALLSFILVNK